MRSQLKTPVVYIFFNRPSLVKITFEKIREIKPEKLYLISDGPRSAEEENKVNQCRNLVDNLLDWPCEVYRNYSDTNLGLRKRVSTGLNWVFSRDDQAIILEDDCLPDLSFFRFCEIMLNRYENDFEVMHICGDNFLKNKVLIRSDYYFSRIAHVWGWATWKRAWEKFDQSFSKWPSFRDDGFKELFGHDVNQYEFWKANINLAFYTNHEVWSPQWVFTIFESNGKCIMPAKNLIKNLGFGLDATHTKGKNKQIEEIPLERLESFIGPATSEIDQNADDCTFYNVIHQKPVKLTLRDKLIWRFKKWLRS